MLQDNTVSFKNIDFALCDDIFQGTILICLLLFLGERLKDYTVITNLIFSFCKYKMYPVYHSLTYIFSTRDEGCFFSI
jgi:hypothetical protein